jgi:hypothetical protein
VLVAPSMLLVPEVSWSPVDGNSFDQALTDHGRTVTARVSVDASGAPTDFSTTDRFCYNPERPKQLMRARWSTPFAGWTMVDGRWSMVANCRPLPRRCGTFRRDRSPMSISAWFLGHSPSMCRRVSVGPSTKPTEAAIRGIAPPLSDPCPPSPPNPPDESRDSC